MKLARIVTDGRLAAIAILGLAGVWTLHVVLTQLGDAFGRVVDAALWVVGSGFKCLSLVALPIVLANVYAAIAGSARRSCIAFAVWWATLSLLVVALAASRDLWANAASTDFFHGDLFPDALLLDSLFFFVAIDPYTTIAIPFYAALFGSALVILQLPGRGVPETLPNKRVPLTGGAQSVDARGGIV